jgi:hypothetical protein
MDLSRALALAADGRDRALADLIELARIPSVSTDPAYAGDVARAADWLAERLRALGLDVSVEPGDPHPVVCAEWIGRPGAPVLGLYSHYDVQPPDPLELWDSGPFDPVVHDGALVARGVRDDKGQLVAGLKASMPWPLAARRSTCGSSTRARRRSPACLWPRCCTPPSSAGAATASSWSTGSSPSGVSRRC